MLQDLAYEEQIIFFINKKVNIQAISAQYSLFIPPEQTESKKETAMGSNGLKKLLQVYVVFVNKVIIKLYAFNIIE